MKLSQSFLKQQLLLLATLFLVGACKQSDFYDKSLVLDTIKKTTPDDQNNDPSNQDPNGSNTNPVSQNPGNLPPTNSNPNLPGIPNVPTTNPSFILSDRSEFFVQNSSRDGDVDILWVIDDSGSMADNQDSLARNFNLFINQFLEKNIDFKMAITTTDGTDFKNGRMVGESSRLTRASANGNKQAFINNFTNWIKVGTSGSGVEQGLKCTSGFLDRYASSFLRNDAFLVIVIVSDENDQSEKKVSEYITRFQSAKNQKGLVKVYSIVTQKLPPNSQWETIGTRYNEVSIATGGLTNDITSDFAITLKDIGSKIVNLVDSFAIAETPFEDKVQVFVNKVEKNSGWVFDPKSRTVKFTSDFIPAEGSQIEIKYKVKAAVLGAI